MVFFGSRRHMWFTSSKRTFMERFSVLSWWATSVQREALTHLVRHISVSHTQTQTPHTWGEFKYIYIFYLIYRLSYIFSNRSPHWGHQQWHWGGQGQVGAPWAPRTERWQLLHQRTQFVFTPAHRHSSIHITDDYKWSLTAGCDCSTLHTHSQRHTHTRTTHRFPHKHRLVCLSSLKCTASFWDLSAVAIAVHRYNHKEPIFCCCVLLCVSVFKDLFSFLSGFIADSQSLNRSSSVYIHTRLPHSTT